MHKGQSVLAQSAFVGGRVVSVLVKLVEELGDKQRQLLGNRRALGGDRHE